MLIEGTLAPYFILYQCFISTSSFDIFIVESICIAPFVLFDSLRPSQQFFSFFRTGLPGEIVLSKD